MDPRRNAHAAAQKDQLRRNNRNNAALSLDLGCPSETRRKECRIEPFTREPYRWRESR